MTSISLIHPLDQPLGKRRLLGELKDSLSCHRFANFRIIVAYARSGPLLRLEDLMRTWRDSGKHAEAILGIDQRGTSQEALELALSLFDRVYVTREPGVTFHPKIYLFTGDHFAHAFVGSNNLTVGGTEKNFEAAVQLKLRLPEDAQNLAALELAWSNLLPSACPATIRLNEKTLGKLIQDQMVLKEKAMRHRASDRASVGRAGQGARSGLAIKPESPIPKKKLQAANKISDSPLVSTGLPRTRNARGFVIQIKPHHNGEILLSLTAVDQNPSFFGWPFTGKTTPKKAGNPSYPQLEPDPIVNITVFDKGTTPKLTLPSYPLNTVFYKKKGEVRITASPLVKEVPEYSVMIMEKSNDTGIDYEIVVHTPDSPEYAAWEAACNHKMPGGGKKPRKYGWF